MVMSRGWQKPVLMYIERTVMKYANSSYYIVFLGRLTQDTKHKLSGNTNKSGSTVSKCMRAHHLSPRDPAQAGVNPV